MTRAVCFFHARGGCDGRLDRGHWLQKQAIKRAFPHGLMRSSHDGTLAPQARNEDFCAGGIHWEPVSLDLVIWDPRVWSPMCRKHHFDFDAYKFRIGRHELPPGVEEFASQFMLSARLDHEFGLHVDEEACA